jgi:rhomboid protease GluP
LQAAGLRLTVRNRRALHCGGDGALILPVYNLTDGLASFFVFTSILIAGTLAERLWGSGRWLNLYIASGLTGEVAGYAWQPFGAGASNAKPGAAARFGGAIILIGAVVLIYLRELRGQPVLAGAFLGFAMAKASDSHSGQRSPAKADSAKN